MCTLPPIGRARPRSSGANLPGDHPGLRGVPGDYDVLAHLTYIGKAPGNVSGLPVLYANHRALVDEILRVLAKKGKGLELNTSGKDRCGAFLPDEPYFRRFRELGGEIVTIGSDAHTADRVGQYSQGPPAAS